MYDGSSGWFAFVEGRKSPDWVRERNIAAVHSKDQSFAGKWLRVYYKGRSLDVQVLDYCSDAQGPCTRNMQGTGFLIDLERNTARRLGLTAQQGIDVAEFEVIG